MPTYTLGFNNPEFENYTGLTTDAEVGEALMDECVKSVEEAGSDAFDPSDILPDEFGRFDTLLDPHGYMWGEAHSLAVKTAAFAEAARIMRDSFVLVLAGGATEADALIDVGGAQRVVVWLRDEDAYEAEQEDEG